jgi:amino acid adenylation domain-containing protein/non-ribosomal peptide synthase protein (TIGR01720 family)
VTDGHCSLSYEELNLRADEMAARLRGAGVVRGTYVGLYLDRSVDLVVALLAVLKAGGAYVPIDVNWPEARFAQIASSLEMTHCVTQVSLAPVVRQFQSKSATLRHVISIDAMESNLRADFVASKDFSAPKTQSPPAATDTAYVIFTSGSTGQPKGVVVTHRSVINVIEWVNKTFGVGARDKLLFVTSVTFDLSVYDVFGILAAGGCIRVATRKELQDPSRLLAILRDEEITFWDSAPAALQQLVHEMDVSPRISKSLRLVFLSGDWIPLSLPATIKQSFPNSTVVALGGATEATIWSNFHVVDRVDPSWKSIPYGRPIQNARYYVLNQQLDPCAVGIAGRLFIGGECLATGYANAPALTAERFVTDPFAPDPGVMYDTGDLAKFWPDGTIELLGRVDNQVKINGYRIELGEIESALLSHPAVRQAVVIARDLSRRGKQLVAYVVINQEVMNADALRKHLSELLPHYMVPKLFVELSQIPLTTSGKADRRALPEVNPDQNRAPVFEAPANSLERQIAKIWETVLGVSRIGRHDGFIALGGDSLMSVEVAVRAASAGLVMTPQLLLDHPSLKELAAAISDLAMAAPEVVAAGDVPLTPIQHWFFQRQLTDPENYTSVFAYEIQEPHPEGLLEDALKRLAERHDALRLKFTRTGQGWKQTCLSPDDVRCPVTNHRIPGGMDESGALREVVESLRSGISVDEAPLWRVALVSRANGSPAYLILAIHHLIFDGLSLRILLEDLATAWQSPARLHGQSGASFSAWANQLSALSESSQLKASLNFWRERPWSNVSPLPRDHIAPNTYQFAQTIRRRFSKQETGQLLANAPARGSSASNHLLAGLAIALARWSRQSSVLIDLTTHGRETFEGTLNVWRTAGYFTENVPVLFSIPNIEIEAQFENVASQLQEYARHLPAWGLLRYLNAAHSAELKSFPAPEIKFNFLGTLDAPSDAILFGARPVAVSSGVLAAENPRAYLLNLELAIVDGQLDVVWKFNSAIHQHASIKRLADIFEEVVLAKGGVPRPITEEAICG